MWSWFSHRRTAPRPGVSAQRLNPGVTAPGGTRRGISGGKSVADAS
jgi:hypothetical protein